jgi:hypothetical protein
MDQRSTRVPALPLMWISDKMERLDAISSVHQRQPPG